MQNILNVLKESFIEITNLLRHHNSLELSEITNNSNATGDKIKKLDFMSNVLIKNKLLTCKNIRTIASEEEDTLLETDNREGDYMVSYDPIDGSSNIGVNITVGTIFCIFKYNNNQISDGRNIVMSGYSLYGSSTQLVLGYIDKVHKLDLFILNKNNEFILVKPNHKMPREGNQYAINHCNQYKWINTNITIFIESLIKKNKTQRWVGSLVADAHRTLIKGGVFIYPITSNLINGKIRLIYEAYPMAFIFKCAGGYSYDETKCILNKPFPNNIHEKTSILLFGKYEFNLYKNLTY